MSTAAPVAGVLLAAGQGARFGKPKALAEFQGASLADRGARMLRDGGATPVVVVTGAVAVSLAPDVSDAILAYNPGWRGGMGSSLAVGLRAVPAAAGAAVVALVDQPLVGPQAVRRLIAARRDGAGVAVAAYRGVAGNPVLLAREHWAEVIELAVGDVGARPFLRAHCELVTLVECGDTGDPADADTPADLAAFAQSGGRISAAGTQDPRNGQRSGQDPG
ncbi:MAG TPA: nucleotidyltransferase family protein [Streptosporangiaceae bacterium]|nr:nucleotidyltransferase family protein [Streptosporangiaceae bacterium]